jgi:branched-chain amino acid aminotransferase
MSTDERLAAIAADDGPSSADDRPVTVWCNGDLVREDLVRISPFDHGLLTGDGVFESLVTERGVPFAWTRHLARLRHSAGGMGLDLPSGEELRDGVRAVVAANGFGDATPGRARVRITVTGGVAPPGSGRGTSSPLVLVTATALAEPPATTEVVTVPWTRNEHGAVAGLKTTSYAENVVALARAHQHGATEALIANTAGNLCEGTGANVFCVVGGELVTPPLSSGCLAGVTRALVQELTGAAERDLPFAALAEIDEAFLTSTTRGVQAITTLDGRPLTGAAGPSTRAAASALAALVARDLDP